MDADVLAWGLPARPQEQLRQLHPQVVVAAPTLPALHAALRARRWDHVVVGAAVEQQMRAAAAAAREHPPAESVVLVGPIVPDLFEDATSLPYDVWFEAALDEAPALLRQALESHANAEAMEAVATNRRLSQALDGVLVDGASTAVAMEQAMGIVAAAVGCEAASFWRATGLRDELRRVACTGPLSRLDVVAAGDERPPAPGCDRLLELSTGDTIAGEVLRSGRTRVSGDGVVLPASAAGAVTGVLVLAGTADLTRRPTRLELAVSAANRLAAYVELRSAQDQFAAVTTSSSDAIVVIDATGEITEFNAGAQRLFGRPLQEALQHQVAELFAPGWWLEHRDVIDGLAARALDGTRARAVEVDVVTASGWSVPVEVTASAWGEGGDRRWAGILRDISDRRHAEAQLLELAYTSAVSGLGNRHALARTLTERSGPVTLTAIAIERFDVIAETLGAGVAEQLLRRVVTVLRTALNGHQRLFQLDERTLAVLGPKLAASVAEHEQRLHAAISTRFVVADTVLVVDGCLATLPTRGTVDPTDAGRAIDQLVRALAARRATKHGAVPPGPEQLRLEGELHQAVANGELRLHYQPVVDLATQAVRGFEALVRWEHPTRGLLGPGAFVGLAEETDLINLVGAWVIAEACRQSARWRAAGMVSTISCNVAPRQLIAGDCAALVADALRDSGAVATDMIIEVTESSALRDLHAGIATLRGLRELGVLVALDDFGVGESSLQRLAQLPVDILKIDRSFVTGLPDEAAARALSNAAIELARGLGLRPHAEGVETPQQHAWLRDAGCDHGQGFLYARPMPADAVPAWIADQVAATAVPLQA